MVDSVNSNGTVFVEGLADLLAAYDEHKRTVSESYDEVLADVSTRIAESGSIGKLDIGALVLWKRLRADTLWARRLMATPEKDVRSITAAAVTAANDRNLSTAEAGRQSRDVLRKLHGFRNGFALASALLTAAAPERLAVYDRRAHTGLTMLGLAPKRGYSYGDYIERLEVLRLAAHDRGRGWTNRDVDLALFSLGARSKVAKTSDRIR